MSAIWSTKYGLRRVRHEPPTLEEALIAAEGMATDDDEKIQMAADLMHLPVDQVRAEVARMIKEHARRHVITPSRRPSAGAKSGGAQPVIVVVERKFPRRISLDARKTSSMG